MSQTNGDDLAGLEVSGQRRRDQWGEESEGSVSTDIVCGGGLWVDRAVGERHNSEISSRVKVCCRAVIGEAMFQLAVSLVRGKRGGKIDQKERAEKMKIQTSDSM